MTEELLEKGLAFCNRIASVSIKDISAFVFLLAIVLAAIRVIWSIRAEIDIYHGVDKKTATKYYRKIFHREKRRVSYEKERREAYANYARKKTGRGLREKATIGGDKEDGTKHDI